MKYLLLVIFMFIAVPLYAEVYVIYDNTTNDVVSAIEEDIAIVGEGQTKVVLPKKLKFYDLQYHPTYYKFIDGQFILNTSKISNEYNNQQSQAEEKAEWLRIRERALKMACDSLEQDGVVFKYIQCSDFN